ncbi:MAG: SNF2 helicase associated domain-containing protein [Prevotellaceae bacterium]|jgi:hypothetical protein|nr:SNF2 helicase associated domain-containing protein [Prevotellaceae bacterium]
MLALTLYAHPVFGWKFTLYSVERLTDESFLIQGVPSPQDVSEPVCQTLFTLSEGISDQALRRAYSRKDSWAEFKEELTEQTLQRYIRPRIDIANRKIWAIVRHTDMPLFVRLRYNDRVLLHSDRLQATATNASAVFNFIREENGLHYFISLTYEGADITLQTTPHAVVAEKPCIVLVGDTLYEVSDIEAKKLTPFFQKARIEVPARTIDTYLRTFVIKTMQQYEVRLQGITQHLLTPERKAILSLEKDFGSELVILLWFQYGDDTRIHPDQALTQRIRVEEGSIYRYRRDSEWEANSIALLQEKGLHCVQSNHYKQRCGNADNPYSLLEWLNVQEEVARHFVVEQHLEHIYYTGTLTLQVSISEKVDWFDVRILVVVGHYKLPFRRFRKHILKGNRDYLLPDGKILILPDEWFTRYGVFFRIGLDDEEALRIRKMHAPALKCIADYLPLADLEHLQRSLEPPTDQPPVPASLQVRLRPYQMVGFRWLANLYRQGWGGCLSDDMGLGKTVQMAALLQLKRGIKKRLQEYHYP